MTHISYATAKALKEFLGDKCPKPLGKQWWLYYPVACRAEIKDKDLASWGAETAPAYRLEDLLSKKFGAALFPKLSWQEPKDVQDELYWAWLDGGLPAVERELMKLMEGK